MVKSGQKWSKTVVSVVSVILVLSLLSVFYVLTVLSVFFVLFVLSVLSLFYINTLTRPGHGRVKTIQVKGPAYIGQ